MFLSYFRNFLINFDFFKHYACCQAPQRASELRVHEELHCSCRAAPLRPTSSSLSAFVPQVLPRYYGVSWEASFQNEITGRMYYVC